MIEKPIVIKKTRHAIIFTVIAIVLILSLLSTIYALTPFAFTDGFGRSKTPTVVDNITPTIKSAGSESQFQVGIAYAYVGPLPADKASYYSKTFNETMVHSSNYPSAVFLNFTRVPLSQIGFCDAVIQVYGVKVAADTGPTEYFAWSAGTNYTAVTKEDFNALIRCSDNLIDRNLYRSIGGTFIQDWVANRSILSHTIGSVGRYTGDHSQNKSSTYDLTSAGIPNSISVEAYRIGYVTMTSGSFTIYEETEAANKPVAYVQLSKYEGGFIYNNIVSTGQLTQIDLFHPTR